MSWIQDHGLVLVLLLGYTVLLWHHARAGKRGTKGLADYYIGGRKMGGVALGLSFFATYSSTNSFIGFAGQAYTYGLPWLLLAPSVVVFSAIAWIWIAPRLRRATADMGSLTIPDFIGFRFGSDRARFLAALIVLFASFFYMAAIFKGIGNLLEVFLGIHYVTAIAVVFVIVMVYTATGGFISVVKTDVVQGLLMVVAAVLLFSGTVRMAGGVSSFVAVRDRPEAAHLFSWDAAMAFPLLIGIIVAGTIKFLVEPRQLSRFYALADDREARRGMWVSTLTFLVVYSLLVPLGIYAWNILPEKLPETDLVIPTLLSDGAIFGPFVGSLVVVAMIAAAMSSLDSVLLVTASTCQRDIVGLFRKSTSEHHALRATRLYVVLFALITAIIALDPPGSVVTLTAFSGSLYAACFLPAIFLGLYWRRGNGAAVVSSFVAGIGTLLLWPFLPLASSLHAVFPAMFLSAAAYIVLSRARPQVFGMSAIVSPTR